jgi:hypothetical protein
VTGCGLHDVIYPEGRTPLNDFCENFRSQANLNKSAIIEVDTLCAADSFQYNKIVVVG